MSNGVNLPNVWGAGQLLAFSGIDGHADWSQPFVLHTDREPGSFIIRLPVEVHFAFTRLEKLRFRMILGDTIEADTAKGPFLAAFLDHHALIGQAPAGSSLIVGGQTVKSKPVRLAQHEKLEVYAVAKGRRWAVIVGDGKPSAQRIGQVLTADLDQVIHDRAAYVRGVCVPKGLTPEQTRLLLKAVSVMKVNVEAPCGKISRRWTTPDRWPHRHMWLWDSAFHTLGMVHVDPEMAKDAVLAMLEQTRPDGFLPHMIFAKGDDSEITQPPLLGWAVLTVLDKTADLEFARQCLPHLQRYLEWDRVNRDKNNNGIPEWYIEGNALCRSGESGLDNSSRFDRAVLLDAPDFAAWFCHDYQCLAAIADRLGEKGLKRSAAANAQRIAKAVNKLLWSDEHGMYMDRDFDGNFVDVKAVSGFMPLFASIAPPARAKSLRDHLANPSTFGTAFPIPSISLDSGTFCKDMWRGPTWINCNYMVCLGLRRNGFAREAARLKKIMLDRLAFWYEKEGCLFEFYDSLDVTSPRDLDRKQRLSLGYGMAPISDYHWTAALTAALLMDK